MRTLSAKTKSDQLDTVITDTLKLWRRYHLTYDQTRYVAKAVRRALAIARPPTRQRVIVRLSPCGRGALDWPGLSHAGGAGLTHHSKM